MLSLGTADKTVCKLGLLFLLGLLLFVAAECGQDTAELEIELQEQSDSSQSGIATVKSVNGQTEVSISVNPGSPDDDPQPVHIHFGSCGPGLGEVNYLLNDVVVGVSTTVVDVSLPDLLGQNNAINLHKSGPEITVHTACGNIADD